MKAKKENNSDKSAKNHNVDMERLCMHMCILMTFINGVISKIPENELRKIVSRSVSDSEVDISMRLIEYAREFTMFSCGMLDLSDDEKRAMAMSEVSIAAFMAIATSKPDDTKKGKSK